MSNLKGNLIIFEGIDHVGKSTISNLVFQRLKGMGVECVLYQYPGNADGTLGKIVYDIHHQRINELEYPLDPLSIQMLHVAAHIDLLNKKIIYDIDNGKYVLLDRYWWSTLAYGISDGIKKEKLSKLIDIEKDITDHIENKTYFYITRESREKDFSDKKDDIIFKVYEELFCSTMDGKKYLIENNMDIDFAVESVIQRLKIRI
ncbi:MAG: hypothetical protein NC311_07330 [Muribaculaceae bacterium]|nr:hypothetical protein [Muribaculaceae bacterium]